MELLHLGEVLAHPPERLGEPGDRLVHLGFLEVAQHLVAVAHGRGLVQRRVEERLQLVLLPTGGHRPKHLIEIQVDEEVRLLQSVDAGRSLRLLEEHAVKWRAASERDRAPADAPSAANGEPDPDKSEVAISFHRFVR